MVKGKLLSLCTMNRFGKSCNCCRYVDGFVHANCLNAKDTPSCTTPGLPPGSYSFYSVTPLFPAGLAVGTKLLVMI